LGAAAINFRVNDRGVAAQIPSAAPTS